MLFATTKKHIKTSFFVARGGVFIFIIIMKSEDVKQTIIIKTEHMDRKTHLGLRSLITKYYFQFNSITEENTDYKIMQEIKLEANFYSLGEMFQFNKELQEILL